MDLPPGYDLHRALAAAAAPAAPGDWRLVQRGSALVVEPWPAAAADLQCGSPLVERLRAERPVAQLGGAALPLAPGAARPLGEGRFTLGTGEEELTIAPLERPPWAHTIGRDRDGLFVGFDDGPGERRAYWCGPWDFEPAGGPWCKPGGPAAAGFYMDEAQFRALRTLGLAPPGLGGRVSADDLGLRCEIEIAGETQGFRWVWPGRFLMGSPEEERGRSDDETQHEVILTRGFWLAETACTQALWQVVMGDNPSYGKGPQRPVETVSFQDVHRFLQRANTKLASLTIAQSDAAGPVSAWRLRLPSESEWEYACRAGTTTAYSFGDKIDPKAANAERSTVDVRYLPANPWGFYEMHGNIDEWCQDWYGAYPTGTVLDPQGAASGEQRVLRGGDWIFVAVNLRSAYRLHAVPGDCDPITGFRLALGPELRPAG